MGGTGGRPARRVLVTGANSGIGLTTALELAAHGFDVIGSARAPDKAQRLHDAAAERGLSVGTVLLDVDDADSCARAVAEVGPLWGLVNNAGFAQSGAVEDVDDDLVRRQLETNLVAPARLARLVLPGMRAAGEGRIVNISSVVGRLSFPLMGWYCASKHALEAVSDALRAEVAAEGVRVVLVEPGMTGTDVWSAVERALPEPTTPRYARAYDRVRTLTDRGSLLPGPEHVARAVRLALTHPRPLARYPVGPDTLAGIAAQRLLPTPVTDAVKRAMVALWR